MPELILILFKINLVLLLFAAAYYLVLRRLTFYTVNRVFLVGGIIFSTVYPFINLTDFFHRQQQINPTVTALVPTIDVNEFIKSNSIVDYWQIAILLFFTGMAFMMLRLIAQFVSLYRVHKSSKPGAVGNLPVRILDGPLSPFSFWQTVYVNPAIHSENELSTILAHERIHVKEWHTLDIILAEISVVFYWFNPGVWLMKRAIKENIEFITDASIVKRGIDKKAYQYSLLGVGNLQASVALVNNFNLSDLKKRIKMMNAKRSSPRKLLIYALILPVLLLTTLAFTVTKKEVKKHLLPLTAALSNVTLFDKPTVEVSVSVPKVKAKRKAKKTKLELNSKDTVKQMSYVVSTIVLKSDSSTMSEQTREEMLARLALLQQSLKGKVKGVQLTNTKFSFNFIDTASVEGKGVQAESITVVGRKQGYPIPTNGTLVLRGYKIPKDTDSLKSLNVSYVVNGKPITKGELSQIKGDDLKSVIVRKVDKEAAQVIITAKKD